MDKNMQNAITKLKEVRIVPVIKINDASRVESLGEILVEGGLPIAEVTFRTDAAAELVK